GGTTVNDGAALVLQDPGGSPVQVGPETLNAVGAGINFTGALRSLAGASNSWAGTVNLNNPSITAIDAPALFPNSNFTTFTGCFIGVDAGKLSLSGVLNASDPIKMGAGTLELAGVNSTGIPGRLRLKQGTMLLNKAPGVSAINASNPVLVGDDLSPG